MIKTELTKRTIGFRTRKKNILHKKITNNKKVTNRKSCPGTDGGSPTLQENEQVQATPTVTAFTPTPREPRYIKDLESVAPPLADRYFHIL